MKWGQCPSLPEVNEEHTPSGCRVSLLEQCRSQLCKSRVGGRFDVAEVLPEKVVGLLDIETRCLLQHFRFPFDVESSFDTCITSVTIGTGDQLDFLCYLGIAWRHGQLQQ